MKRIIAMLMVALNLVVIQSAIFGGDSYEKVASDKLIEKVASSNPMDKVASSNSMDNLWNNVTLNLPSTSQVGLGLAGVIGLYLGYKTYKWLRPSLAYGTRTYTSGDITIEITVQKSNINKNMPIISYIIYQRVAGKVMINTQTIKTDQEILQQAIEEYNSIGSQSQNNQ